MKKLFLIFLIFLAGCAGMKTTQQDPPMTITKVIEVDGASKDQIFKNAHNWVVRYWRLNSANPGSGIILGTGEVGYPSAPADRVEYTYVFQMRQEIRDNKDTITFEKIMLKSPKNYIQESAFPDAYYGGEESPVTSKRDLETAQYLINYISDNLKDSLQTKGS